MKLWVDDERLPPAPEWVHARTSEQAIVELKRGSVLELSLDHDLGGADSTRPVVLWLCERPEFWPPIVRVHSMNPVGRAWLVGMVHRYNPHLNGGK